MSVYRQLILEYMSLSEDILQIHNLTDLEKEAVQSMLVRLAENLRVTGIDGTLKLGS
jgi:hypothetical protein